MASFGFFQDSGLTQPIVGNYQIGEGTNDYRFYLGCTDASKKLQDAASPGVTALEIDIADANPGSGPETSWVKLALTQGGLSTAVAGASLSVGTTILGGAASAVPFWVRIGNTLSGVTSSIDLSLAITGVKEFPV
jgi:hypothetical protein